MKNIKKKTRPLKGTGRLKARLAEAEELLAAIQSGSVDAFVTKDQKVFTLKGADHGYRVLVETINEGTATLAFDGTLMYCNGRLASMLGLPVEKIVGNSLFDFFGPNERRKLQSMLRQSREQTARVEFRLKRKDGTLLPVLVSCNSLKLGNAGLCVVITDLTGQKNAELQLQAKNRQLRHLADTLFHAEDEERKRLGDILHDDLQQILVACMIRMNMPRHSRKNRDEINKLLVDAIAASRTLSAELRPPVLFESGLVAGVRWFIARIVKQLGLKIDLHSDGYEEIADQNINVMLYQCVRESIFNIIKYAQVPKAVLTFATVKGQSEIRIKDRGRGFAVSETGGRKAGEAGGLGFFSIEDRLRAIGGRFRIESNPGRGTVVTLIVPPQDSKSFYPPAGGAAESPPRKTAVIRVLVADDHKLVREGIVNALSAEKDIAVIGQAEDGFEAVAKTGRLKPDVVVLDLNMPALNGIEAARRLRRKKVKVKILVISVNSDKGTARTVLKAGADAFLSKSVDLGELLKVIRTIAS